MAKIKITNLLLGLVFTLIPIAFLPYLHQEFILIKNVLFTILAFLALFAWTWELRNKKQFLVPELLKSRAMQVFMVVSMAVTLLGTFFSVAPELSFWGSYFRMQGGFFWLTILLFLLLLIANFKEEEDWRLGAKFVVAGWLIVIVYSVIFDWRLVAEGRIFATLGHPSYLASYLVVSLFILLHFWRKWAVLWIGMTMVMMIFSGSRAGLMALILGLNLYFLILKDRKARKIFLISELVVFLVALVTAVWWFDSSRFDLNADNLRSWKSRQIVWQAAVQTASERTLLGHGLESFGLVVPANLDPEIGKYEAANSLPDKAHNMILELMVNLGVMGIFWFLALVNLFIYVARSLESRELKALFIATNLGLGLNNMLSFSTISDLVILVFVWALVIGLAAEKKVRIKYLRNVTQRKVVAGFCGLVAVLVVFLQGAAPVVGDRALARGLEDLAAGRGETVLNDFAKADLWRPKQSYYGYLLADGLRSAGEYQLAEMALEKAGSFSNYHDPIYYFYGWKLYEDQCEKEGNFCEKSALFLKRGKDLAPSYGKFEKN